jgi:hypothetical protein
MKGSGGRCIEVMGDGRISAWCVVRGVLDGDGLMDAW